MDVVWYDDGEGGIHSVYDIGCVRGAMSMGVSVVEQMYDSSLSSRVLRWEEEWVYGFGGCRFVIGYQFVRRLDSSLCSGELHEFCGSILWHNIVCFFELMESGGRYMGSEDGEWVCCMVRLIRDDLFGRVGRVSGGELLARLDSYVRKCCRDLGL